MIYRALLTGISGQDGSYLAELLLEKGYEVYGVVRRTSQNGLGRIAHIADRLFLLPGDVTDLSSLERVVRMAMPHEVYNLESQSYVPYSFDAPLQTIEVTGVGAINVFEAVRLHAPGAKIYQASSSEQFGNATESPQTETTPFHPISPYACAKVLAHLAAQVYRKTYEMYISCGIAFNHESPRRGEEFVTRKITQAIGRIKVGAQQQLSLGNTASRRDWSHAKDIMMGAWLTLQRGIPDEYVFASGVSYSVKEFYELAFNYAGLDPNAYVNISARLARPQDIHDFVGDASKAKRELGWSPIYSFRDLVREMVESECANAEHRDPQSISG